MIGMAITTVLAYTFWVQRPYTQYAKIATNIDFNLYEDEACTIPYTGTDWGDFGAGEKIQTVYIQIESNDVTPLLWNITEEEWVWDPVEKYYSDSVFNFTIYRGEGTYDPLHPTAGVWMPNGQWWEEDPGNVVPMQLRTWTDLYLKCEDSWTMTWYAYDIYD